MYPLRLLWYFFRISIYLCISLLRLISRPGSRIIIVLVILGLAFLLRGTLHEQLTRQLQNYDAGYQPEGVLLDAIAVILTLTACAAYAILSALLNILLGAFRVGMRPLAPQRKLKPTEAKITNAVVRIVVPPLPKRAR